MSSDLIVRRLVLNKRFIDKHFKDQSITFIFLFNHHYDSNNKKKIDETLNNIKMSITQITSDEIQQQQITITCQY